MESNPANDARLAGITRDPSMGSSTRVSTLSETPPGRTGRDTRGGFPLPAALMIVAFFLLLTLISFFPLCLQPSGHTILGGPDKYIFLWDLWWVGSAVTEPGRSLFFTDFLFHPEGTGLIFHTLCPLGGLLMLPLTAMGGVILSHNMLLFMFTFLAAVFTCILTRELLGRETGYLTPILAGVIFAFCPARWIGVMAGHLNMAGAAWLPLYLFFLVRLLRGGRYRDAAGLALTAAAMLYTGYQLLVFAAYWSFLLLVPLWPELRLRDRWGRHSTRLLAAVLFFLLLASPILLEAAKQRRQAVVKFHIGEARGFSLGLDAIFLNTSYQHFWHPAGWTRYLNSEEENIVHPTEEDGPPTRLQRFLGRFLSYGPIFGYVVAVLLLTGLIIPQVHGGGWKYLRWWVPALFFLYMCLGPHPTLFGHPVPGLYNRFYPIPILGAVRAVYRFAVPMMLAVAIASAFGARALRVWFDSRAGGIAAGAGRLGRLRFAVLLPALLAGLVYLEYLRIPIAVGRPPEPPELYRSAEFQSRFDGTAVLELPLWLTGADFHLGREVREHLYHQTIHRLPQVGGHMSRLSSSHTGYFTAHPGMMALTGRDTKLLDETAGKDLARAVRSFNVGVINLNREYYRTEEERALIEFLGRWLDLEPLGRDTRFITWAVNPAAQAEIP